MTKPNESDCPADGDDCLLAEVITAAELHHVTFAPLAEFVPGLVIEGFGIVAGPPKLGKSWWTLNLALAVAAGGRAFGKIPVPARDVLLLALEDSHRRVQARIRDVWGEGIPPHRLHLLTEVGPGLLLATVTAWLEHHPAGLVILDTLGRARQQRRRGDDPYLADYQAGVALKNVVDAFPGSALLGVHHTRKASSDDFVDDLSGTLGLAGSADYILVLRRQRNSTDANLQVTGRDAPEGEYAFTVAGGAWTLSGEGLAAAATEAQNRRETKNLGDRALEALAFVNAHPAGVSPEDVAGHLNISSNDAGTYLRRLRQKGCIDKPTRGIYTPVSVSEVSEVSYSQVDGPPSEESPNRGVSEVSETEQQTELFNQTDSDTPVSAVSEVSEVRNSTELHKDNDSHRKDTSDTKTDKRIDWPGRQDWEADARGIAQWMVDTGHAQGGDETTFTVAERDEAEALAKVVVKQFRAACGRVERATRAQHPGVAQLFDRRVAKFASVEDVEAWQAPIEALAGAERDAFDLLVTMRDIRASVKRMTRSHLTPYEIRVKFNSQHPPHWPKECDHPASPEITRLAELVSRADRRRAECNRQRGREMLAALEAPDAWEKELARRAEVEAYFRNGPIVHRHHSDGTVTTEGRL